MQRFNNTFDWLQITLTTYFAAELYLESSNCVRSSMRQFCAGQMESETDDSGWEPERDNNVT
jgi:hypothetical protein